GEGDGDKGITALAGEGVQAAAFTADHQHRGRAKVVLPDGGGSGGIEADDPPACVTAGFERLDQVAGAGHADVLQRPGGDAVDGLGEPGGAAAGEHDAIGASAAGGTHDGAQVVGVLDAVEGEQELLGGGGEQ